MLCRDRSHRLAFNRVTKQSNCRCLSPSHRGNRGNRPHRHVRRSASWTKQVKCLGDPGWYFVQDGERRWKNLPTGFQSFILLFPETSTTQLFFLFSSFPTARNGGPLYRTVEIHEGPYSLSDSFIEVCGSLACRSFFFRGHVQFQRKDCHHRLHWCLVGNRRNRELHHLPGTNALDDFLFWWTGAHIVNANPGCTDKSDRRAHGIFHHCDYHYRIGLWSCAPLLIRIMYHYYLLIIRAVYQPFAVSGCFCIRWEIWLSLFMCYKVQYTGSGTTQIWSCGDSHSRLRFPRRAGGFGVWGVDFEFGWHFSKSEICRPSCMYMRAVTVHTLTCIDHVTHYKLGTLD